MIGFFLSLIIGLLVAIIVALSEIHKELVNNKEETKK